MTERHTSTPAEQQPYAFAKGTGKVLERHVCDMINKLHTLRRHGARRLGICNNKKLPYLST